MKLEHALHWAQVNCTEEAVARLRSRAVVATLVDEIERLRAEIERLRNVVTSDHETKADFIARVREVLEGNA